MAPKAAQAAAQKKAAKQRKMLALLAIPAAGAIFFAVHTFMGIGSHPSPVAVTPAADTTPAGAIPSGTSSNTAAPVTPGVVAPPVGSLRSFVALGRKDPFHDAGPKASSASSSSSSKIADAGSGSKSGSKSGSGSGSGSNSKQPPVPLTGAVISINGNKLNLALKAKFGHAPGLTGVSLFRLVSVTRTTAVIGVVGTTQRFTLHVRQPLTLQQSGGWRYTLLLEPVGSMTVVQSNTTTTSGG